MAFHYSPRIVTDGLVLYLDAANTRSYPGGGTTWNDLTRFGNNGSIVNSPEYSTEAGGCFVFNTTGLNQYVNTNNSVGNGTQLSVETWFKTSGTAAASSIVSKAATGGQAQFAVRMGFSPNQNRTTFTTFQAGGQAYANALASVTADNTWHQFVGTISNGVELVSYVDGISRAKTSTFTGTWYTSGSADLRIAARADNTSYFTGSISIVRVYNRVLSEFEVLQNYNALKKRYGL